MVLSQAEVTHGDLLSVALCLLSLLKLREVNRYIGDHIIGMTPPFFSCSVLSFEKNQGFGLYTVTLA